MLNLRIAQDMLAAIIFTAVGAAALWFGSDLDPGTSAEMGPGYLPRALGWIILVMGALTALRSVWLQSPRIGSLSLRPILVVLLACACFALLVEPLGFVLATALTVLISTFGLGRPKPLYVLGMTVVLPAALSLIFVVGLGLRFDLWWF